MNFLHLSFLYCGLIMFFPVPASESSAAFQAEISGPIASNVVKPNEVEPAATNIIYQSKDNGKTWQDISDGLPEKVHPQDFFAGESDIYMLLEGNMYRSKSNLQSPVWERENGLDPRSGSIAFNHSAVMAYNYEGQIYQKTSTAGIWTPIYANLRQHSMRSVFETIDGAVFLG